MRVKDAGYMRENIFTVDMYANLKKSSTYIEALKHELKQQPEIADVSTSERNIVDVDNFRALEWDGMPENQIFTTAYMGVDRNFIEMLGMEIASGHGFTGTPADSSCFFVNETAVKQMGLTDPLNTSIALWNYKMPIAGVVKDFHFKHMSVPIGTMVMYLSHYHSTLYVKTAAGKTREAVAITESLYRKYDPDFLFTCRFLDDTFAEMYKADTQANMLFNAFAVIAILVSCLGLFGLVTFTAESKTKEIGIRKVFGASVASIVKMLSREFIVLVSVAMLIAFPVAYFWLDRMLQDYAYRINITWWMFALAAGLTVALTLLTVGWQALKAATANPVKSIKTE